MGSSLSVVFWWTRKRVHPSCNEDPSYKASGSQRVEVEGLVFGLKPVYGCRVSALGSEGLGFRVLGRCATVHVSFGARMLIRAFLRVENLRMPKNPATPDRALTEPETQNPKPKPP